MTQIIVGGYPDNLQVNSATTEYNCLQGGYTWTSAETNISQCFPTAGVIDRLYVELNGDPTNAGSYYDFWLVVDGTETALTCRISAGATSANDVAHTVNITAGQTVSIKCTPSVTDPVARMARWSTRFTPTVTNESVCLLHMGGIDGAASYQSLQGYQDDSITTEAYVNLPMPTAGVFKKLFVKFASSLGGAGDAYTIALRLGGATQALTVTVTYADTAGNDSAHTVDVVAGDLVDLILTNANTPATSACAVGLVFVATVTGESLLFGGSSVDTPSTAAVEYLPLCELRTLAWSATEQFSLIQECTVSDLYVALSASPGAGNNYIVSINKDGGTASGITVTIADLATTGNDTTHTYTADDGDTISLDCLPDSTPTARYIRVGMVLFIAAAVTPQAVGSGSITIASTIGLKTKKGLSGAVTIASSLNRKIKKSLSGTVTIASTLGRKILKSLAGVVSISAALNRKTKIAVGDGSITIEAALASLKTFFSAVGDGAIAIESSLELVIKKGVGGAIAIASTLGRNIFVSLS